MRFLSQYQVLIILIISLEKNNIQNYSTKTDTNNYNMILKKVFCHLVCVALTDNGASKKDVLKFLSMEKTLKVHRDYFMMCDMVWRVDEKTFHKNFQKIKKLYLIGDVTRTVDFSNLWYFKSDKFNEPVEDFKNLTRFECMKFNQKVKSFGRLRYFKCEDFNQSVSSFGNLKYFHCFRFNQPVSSFGNLLHFQSSHFNQPVSSFGHLTYFQCYEFNQPLSSFGNLTHFECFCFNQTVSSFGNLTYFKCFYFNQPVSCFGNLTHFECHHFNQPVLPSLDNLKFITNVLKN